MAKYTFKVGFFTQEIDVAKEMIAYKGKTIPGNSVTGVGFTFIKVGYVAVGGAVGGLVGSMIANKGYLTGASIEKDIGKLPENALGQLVVTYSDGTPKQQVLRVPISTKDQNCKNMLLDIAGLFKEKFVGFGPQALVEKELQISQRGALIAVAVIVLIMFAFIAFALASEGGY